MSPGCQRQVVEASSRGRNGFAGEIAAQFEWAERSRPCLECGDPWIERQGAARRAIGPVRCGTEEECSRRDNAVDGSRREEGRGRLWMVDCVVE